MLTRSSADRIAAIPNPTERAAAAVRIFGRAGTELLPLISQGAAGIERFEQRARELGLVTSTESAQAALRFSRALADLQAVLKKCVMVIGSALAPDLEGLVEKITSVAVRVRQWVAENRGLIVTVFKVAGAIVLAGLGSSVLGRVLGIMVTPISMVLGGLKLLGAAVSQIGTLISGSFTVVSAVIGMVGSALSLLLTPIGLVVGAVVGLGAYFLYASGLAGQAMNYLGDVIGTVRDDALEAFGGIRDALASGDIALAAKVLWSLLKLEWQRGVSWITEIWVNVKDFFVRNWTEAVYGIAKIGVVAWGGIQKGWNYLVTGMSAAWTIFCDWVKSAWNAAGNWIQRSWLWIKEKVGAISPDEARKARDRLSREYEGGKQAQRAERERRLGEIGQRFEARQAEISRQGDATLRALDEDKAAKHDARQKAYAEQMAAQQAEVDNAKRELDSLVGQAADRRAKQAAGKAGPGGAEPFADMDLSALPGAKATVVGTFNAAAISGLGLGGGIFQEMKQQLNRIGDNGARLLQEVQMGGRWE
jgi:hypothetical protein